VHQHQRVTTVVALPASRAFCTICLLIPASLRSSRAAEISRLSCLLPAPAL
jgi:hypothetical protein